MLVNSYDWKRDHIACIVVSLRYLNPFYRTFNAIHRVQRKTMTIMNHTFNKVWVIIINKQDHNNKDFVKILCYCTKEMCCIGYINQVISVMASIIQCDCHNNYCSTH